MNATSRGALLERLFRETGYPLISIYMPTHRGGSEIWQGPIRFKNLIRAAEHDLESAGIPRAQINALLQPLSHRLDDREFWQYQGDGLAVFRSADGLDVIQLAAVVPELSIVSSEFHLKPLLMALSRDESFYVLALSQNRAILYRSTSDGRAAECELQEVRDLVFPEWIRLKSGSEGNSPQSHSAGQGVEIRHTAEQNTKAYLVEYCRQVERALAEVVPPHEPVILAAVDQLAALFRDVASRPGLLEQSIPGNPDNATPSQLLKKALPIARLHLDSRRIQAQDRFLASCHTGKGLDEPAATILAARQGRVETLFVPIGVQIWGQIDEAGELSLSDFRRPSDRDLLNLAVIETWKAGGDIFAVTPDQMPGGRNIAALTRF